MPVRSIGTPIDRPIMPSARPDRVGDFVFNHRTDKRPDQPVAVEDEEGEEVRQRLLAMLGRDLKKR